LQFPLPDVPADLKRRILNTLQMHHHDYPFLMFVCCIVVYCLLSIVYCLLSIVYLLFVMNQF
jgi:hypothetical protein